MPDEHFENLQQRGSVTAESLSELHQCTMNLIGQLRTMQDEFEWARRLGQNKLILESEGDDGLITWRWWECCDACDRFVQQYTKGIADCIRVAAVRPITDPWCYVGEVFSDTMHDAMAKCAGEISAMFIFATHDNPMVAGDPETVAVPARDRIVSLEMVEAELKREYALTMQTLCKGSPIPSDEKSESPTIPARSQIELNEADQTVHVDGKTIQLTPQRYKIIACLLRFENRRIKLGEPQKESDVVDAGAILRAMAKKDPWKHRILLPGTAKGRGYGIR